MVDQFHRKTEMSSLEEISRHLRKVKDPGDYWKGKPDTSAFSPESILLFQRRSSSELIEASLYPHQHHRFLLLVSLKGSGTVAIDDQVHRLNDHQSLLLFPFQSHCYMDFSPKDIQWLFITFEHRQDFRLETLRGRRPMDVKERDLIAIGNLLESWRNPINHSILPLHLALWLHQLCLDSKKISERQLAARPQAEFHEFVSAINRFIFEHRNEVVSLGRIAEHFGKSVSTVRIQFRKATGLSLGRHIREVKLGHACQLLHDTKLRIEDISERCGYDSIYAFSRAFHTAHGVSPTSYRASFRVERAK